jgi:hypothetical protein
MFAFILQASASSEQVTTSCMSRRRHVRSFAIAAAILLSVCAEAGAVDAPNLIGNWTRTAFSAATVGESPGYATTGKPSLSHGTDPVWILKINAQDGPAFAGTLTGLSGRPEVIVGAFAQDGTHFVFSTQGDTGSGTADAEQFEYCWTISSTRLVGAGCAAFRRNK